MKRHLNWKIIIASLVAYFATSSTAYADNYNFFFTKPPKKGQKNQQPVISEEEESSEETPEETENHEEEKVERTPVVPPTSAQTSPNTQTVTVPNTQQPIIINNTNNVGYPGYPGYPMPTPSPEVRVNPLTLDPPKSEPEPEPEPLRTRSYDLETRTSAAILPSYQEPNRSNWRMGLSGIMLIADAKKAYSSYGVLNTYDSSTQSWGGLVTLGWDVTKVIGFNFYGGASHNGDYNKLTPHYGADIQIMPLKIPARNFDVLEFGFLAGASNILSNRDHVGAMHVGAKLNVNFGRDYGFTASTRANVGHYLFEAGFVARI